MSRYILKLTGCVVIDGQVRRPGEEVELTDREARNLLARGKAELLGAVVAEEAATDEGGDTDTAAAPDVGTVPAVDDQPTTEPAEVKPASRRRKG